MPAMLTMDMPLSLSLHPNPSNLAKLHPLGPLSMHVCTKGRMVDHSAQARTRPRRPRTTGAAWPCRACRPTCAPRPPVAWPPRATPGPPLSSSSIAVPPRHRQTCSRHRPAPAVAGDGDQTPPRTPPDMEATRPGLAPPSLAVAARRTAWTR